PRARIAFGGVPRQPERFQLGHGRPLRVDRKSAAVRKEKTELDDLAVHAEVRNEHPRRKLGEMLTQDVLPGSPLGRPAGEHRGQSPHDLPLLPIRGAAVLFMGPELLQRSASTLQPLSQLLGRQIALRALVRDAPKLARLELHLIAEPGVVRRAAPGDGDGTAADRQTGNESKDRDRRDGHPVQPRWERARWLSMRPTLETPHDMDVRGLAFAGSLRLT